MENLLVINKNLIGSLDNPTTSELILLINKHDEISLAEYENKMCLEKALEGTTLKKLAKVLDNKNLTKIIVFFIKRLSANFNVGKKFTDDQAVVLAFDLLDVFGHETLEDLLLMFKMARSGKIGDGKDFKLDSQVIFHKWVPEYLELKAEARELKYIKEKKSYTTKELTIEEVKKSYKKKISLQEREDRRHARIDELTKDFTREDLEHLIEEWQKDEAKKKFIRYLTVKRLTIK